jgi:succinylarginine dihydrolase
MEANAFEVNFDGIVGPTHNYSGLSYGNTASEINQMKSSNPREAALQGLEKMYFLFKKGIKQAVLPPQERPFLPVLRQLGFTGTDASILKHLQEQAPDLLLVVSSSAAMWTANAATVSPSSDSQDKRLHLTPANLASNFHRSIEKTGTTRVLKAIFSSPKHFMVHESLPESPYFADEGAANHTRFCRSQEDAGLQLFIYGRSYDKGVKRPKIYPARQTLEASLAIARLHALDFKNTIFAQQHPDAIDMGAFHNDVVSVGNGNVFLFHEHAFLNKEKLFEEINEKSAECGIDMILLEVKDKDISLKDAISSYLFNSQLITLADHTMALIAPIECEENSSIKSYIDSLIASKKNPIQEVHFLNLRQSMQNGGGPACLRLRIVLTQEELAAMHQGVLLTDDLYHKLHKWITVNYRTHLNIKDLSDPTLYQEANHALDELTQLLKLGPLYSFQQH